MSDILSRKISMSVNLKRIDENGGESRSLVSRIPAIVFPVECVAGVDSCYISNRPSNPVESAVTGGEPRGKRSLFFG